MSSRPTSSAPRRSRSAASSAVSQPGSMWMRRPQALQAVEAVLGQPGLAACLRSAPFPAAPCSASRRAPRSACVPPSALTGPAARAALLVERRHLLLQLVQARIGRVLRRFRRPAQLRAAGRPGAPRRARPAPCCSAGQALAPRLELARLLLDVALLGGQHLDLLLHLRRPRCAARWLRACACAQRLFEVGQVAAPALRACAASSSACSSAAGDLRRRAFSISALRLVLARSPTARSAPSARPGAARRAGGLRPRSGCAPRAGRLRRWPRRARPAPACSWSPAA